MLDVSVSLVDETVMDKISKQEMFTAYDITRAVRQRVGKSHRVDHKDVNSEVQRLFSDGEMSDYDRTVANLPISGTQPFVYHPLNADISVYGGAAIPSISIAQEDTDLYKTDARNTLCIPKYLLESVDLKTGDLANVYFDSFLGKVIISKNGLDESVYELLSSYKVDKNGNVRITKYVLSNIGGGNLFDILKTDNEIFVRKHVKN